MKALLFACRLEADPFLEMFGFRQTAEYPFETFVSDGAVMYISGIGPLAAALCADWALGRGASEILNAGACGDLKRSHALGEVLGVSKVVSNEPYCGKVFELGGDGAVLASSSRPVESDAERLALSAKADIVDMEAYGILSALELNRFDLSKFKALKFVSDFSQACDIEKNIKRHIGCLGPHLASWLD